MMKRFFTFTIAAGIAATFSATAWSQAGQGGGGAGAAGASAAGGATGSVGSAGAAGGGTTGNAGAAVNSANAGAAATGSPTAAGNVGVQNPAAANAQARFNFNGMRQTPFFSDRGVRQQLGINDNQFNQLNQAYQQGFQRYNQNQNASLRGNRNSASANAAARQQARQNQTQSRTNPGTAGGGGTTAQQGVTNQQSIQNSAQPAVQSAQPGVQNGQQSLPGGEQGLQSNSNGDFDSTLNSTFTDPAARQRFNQLNIQYQGVGAFSDPMVQQQLNLTAQQQKNFERMATEWQRDLASFQRGRQTSLTQQQFNDLRTRFMNRMNRVLTSEQQQQWLQIVGQPYEFPYAAYAANAATSAQPAQAQGQRVIQQGAPGQNVAPDDTSQLPQPQGSVR